MPDAMNEKLNTAEDERYPAERRCTLVLPGLLDLPPVEGGLALAQAGRLPDLEWFFSRAQRQEIPGVGIEATLFALFEIVASTDADLPVAAVTYVDDIGKRETAWRLRADPVQLIPDRDQLVLMGPESLSLSQAEANQLVTELNAQFALDGWSIEAGSPERWYLSPLNTPGLRTYPLAKVRGQSIADYLPAGSDGKQWQRLMNEIQMVLHSSAVNQQRQTAGQPPVSSLWFWGGGETPSIKHSRWSKLWSDEPVGLGLAALSSTPRRDVPKRATTWLTESISPGEHLIVLDDLSRYWQRGDTAGWVQRVRDMQSEWVLPLVNALRHNHISELTLCTCDGSKYTLSRAGLRRWWRRKKPLAAIADQN